MLKKNDVIYTTWSEAQKINVEHRTTLHRPYFLTRRGAEGILRRESPWLDKNLNVVRVEGWYCSP